MLLTQVPVLCCALGGRLNHGMFDILEADHAPFRFQVNTFPFNLYATPHQLTVDRMQDTAIARVAGGEPKARREGKGSCDVCARDARSYIRLAGLIGAVLAALRIGCRDQTWEMWGGGE